jgi:hypothetical protein
VQSQDTGDVQVITASNVQFEGVSSEPEKFTSAPVSKDKCVKPGDILLTAVGRDYPVAAVPEDFPHAVVGWPLIVISLKAESDVQQMYLVAVLRHEIVKVQLEHMAIGSAQARVAPHLLEDIKIPILTQDEQEIVAKYMKEAEKHRVLVAESLQQASGLIDRALGATGNEA